MREINLGLIESLISVADGMWQACLLLNLFFFPLLRLLLTAAVGVSLLSGLCDPPGAGGGLLLLSPCSLLALLSRLRRVLLSPAGGACGGAQLPRPLPQGAVRVVLRAHWMPGVLSGVLRDLPSQLGALWETVRFTAPWWSNPMPKNSEIEFLSGIYLGEIWTQLPLSRLFFAVWPL